MYIFFKILKSLRNLGGVEGVSRTSILLLKRGYIILPSFFKAWEGTPCYSRCFLRLKHTMEKNHNAEFNSTHREGERERERERERNRRKENGQFQNLFYHNQLWIDFGTVHFPFFCFFLLFWLCDIILNFIWIIYIYMCVCVSEYKGRR